MLLDVTTLERDGWQVVAVVGDVDLSSLPRVWSHIEALDAARVAIDLSAVGWFEPVCSGLLVAAALRATRRGTRCVVVAGEPTAALLAESGLDRVLDVVDDLPA